MKAAYLASLLFMVAILLVDMGWGLGARASWVASWAMAALTLTWVVVGGVAWSKRGRSGWD